MLEKIGLPAKPSLRGSNWVVDASHCQGCSSQFTFINRKHHCRRCGGIFCNGCTQQRMYLRGQGDSPVRICDPCKKLEEAARFEMRHGHKNKAGRGGSKVTTKHEDEVLNQILSADRKQSSLSGRESMSSMISDLERGSSSASCSNFDEEYISQDGKGGRPRSSSVNPQNDTLEEIGSSSLEELRQQALEEKMKYKILKEEGKPEEALKAFKRGKELEREAKALEVALRKNQRKALSSSSLAGVQEVNDDPSRKRKISSQMVKEGKNDLASELRELGWSDADLNDADKKAAKMSLEGELSNLIGEVHKKSVVGKRTGGIDKTEVFALKKKALMYKREGKLAEAKEELKRAKILEQQLEEQELLGEAEDSDDELSSLIHSMDDDKADNLSLTYEQDAGFDFGRLVGVSDDLGLEGSFDVTDEDMHDPEIAAALTSLGWAEDLEHAEITAGATARQSVSVDGKSLLDKAKSLKKEAVRQKQSGNLDAAMTLLRKAKLLERDAENFPSQENSSIAPNPLTHNISTSQTVEISSALEVDDRMVGSVKNGDNKVPPKSKLAIQRELLGLKKKALALRREGRIEEAEEELKKGKVLESQLEEMESNFKVRATTVKVGSKVLESAYEKPSTSVAMGLGEEVDEEDVTEHDMRDPALLSLLENLGWKDEEGKSESFPSKPSKQIGNSSDHVTESSVVQSTSAIPVVAPKRSKAEIQRELLSLKRKALTLRRQGEVEEAEEILRMAKVLEDQMADIEAPKGDKAPEDIGSLGAQEAQRNTESIRETQTTKPAPRSLVEIDVTEPGMHGSTVVSELNNLGLKDGVSDPSITQAASEIPVLASRSKADIQRELLGLKRKALTLRRQGKTEEAEDMLRMVDVLDGQIKETQEKPGNIIAVEEAKTVVSKLPVHPKDEVPQLSMDFGSLGSSLSIPSPRTSIYDPRTSHLVEPDSLSDAKMSEQTSSFRQLDQSKIFRDLLTGDGWQSSHLPIEEVENKGNVSSNIPCKNNLHIQLIRTSESSSKETGCKNEISYEKKGTTLTTFEKIPVHDPNSAPGSDSQNKQSNIQHEVLVHKRKAVTLKREGKLAEALEELRQAKLLEKSQQKDTGPPDTDSIDTSVCTFNETPVMQESKITHQALAPKPMTGRDRFKLQQESLSHKRQALKLRREGRTEEAEAEFELAKALETQLEESSGHDSSNLNKSADVKVGNDDLGVEDLLDPQLLSALKAIGLQDSEIVPQVSGRSEGASKHSVGNTGTVSQERSQPKAGSNETLNQEKSQLEEKIKAEKVKALNLKRAGKQAEALDSLRRSKMYEKKLNSLS